MRIGLKTLLEFYKIGRLKTDMMISRRYGLDEINIGLADMESCRNVRGSSCIDTSKGDLRESSVCPPLIDLKRGTEGMYRKPIESARSGGFLKLAIPYLYHGIEKESLISLNSKTKEHNS